MVFKTYLVWNVAHGIPRYVHDTFDKARAEAIRLANEHPGNTFLVMVPAGAAYVELPAVFTDNPNISFELPF